MASEVITLAERYVLERQIATGGMATVWRARDDVLARTVAVKVLHPHLADDEEFPARFRKEALAAARLAHPNIVAIYDTGEEHSNSDDIRRNYIVMEYCAEGDLRNLSEREGPLGAERALGVACSICDALDYAHGQGVIHRDIKPANVLITSDGTLKVADFSIAKAAFEQGDITTTGTILGSVTYLSPEQATGEAPGPHSDLYSLGVVLYELLAGRPPFVDQSQLAVAHKHARDAPPPLRSMRAGISKPVETAVMKALEKDPGARYSSASEMKSSLESALGGAGSTGVWAPRRERREPADPVVEREPRHVAREARNLLPVLFLVVTAIALALLIPQLVNDDEGGGAPGPSPRANGGPNGTGIEVAAVRAFDPPPGDGEEHSEEAPLASDGDSATSWSTENYNAALSVLDKPGVGLLFDLGDSQAIERVELEGSAGTIELRASGDPGSAADDFDVVDEQEDIAGTSEFDGDSIEARYWLVWITSLPGDGGGSASVAEVRFFGS